ncbi:probable polygalacturonase non-catalytic subunit jp630 [Phtheirospermum japonicum]|uniref:Probable polygalacturonase non-catalytic subunit jp630 n=1 Tax=Phtheirospermum japonicum TaxID=374723 RepID=A0A830BMY0_9LAMI|nr:probable polygalacturonase non-catalytic subunit jp630 [Phtheirospermum japonicum]
MLHHLTLSFSFLLYLNFIISSTFSDPLSSSYSSIQTKFWSENVQNKMPFAISTKLSPLTKHDSDFYAKTISGNSFKADAKFCALAKLACTSDIGHINGVTESYAVKKTYKINKESINTLHNMDPFSFFRLSILKEGNTIHLSNLKESLPYRAFISPQIASKISLTTKGLAQIFPESPKDAIDTTLSYCNAASIKGEIKTCPKSLEEMISFSKTALGTKKLLSLYSESTTGSGQELTIKKVKKFDVEKIVACHEMFLPFATYFCHSLPSSRIYSVDFVEPRTKAPVNTVVAICHMDTSPWPANHVAFEILKFGPGQGEACHWLNQIDLAWIAAGGENI